MAVSSVPTVVYTDTGGHGGIPYCRTAMNLYAGSRHAKAFLPSQPYTCDVENSERVFQQQVIVVTRTELFEIPNPASCWGSGEFLASKTALSLHQRLVMS